MLWFLNSICRTLRFCESWLGPDQRRMNALSLAWRVYGHHGPGAFWNGRVCGVTLRKTYAADAGWMVVTTGWALGVLCGVLVAQAFGSSGAHLNPAITLAAAISSGDFSPIPVYWSAQLLGAMCGATLTILHYGPHWSLTPDPAAKLGIFCTNAAVRSPLFNLFSEALGTGVLVLVAGAIGSHGVSETGPAPGMGPWLVASLVWGIGLSLGATTGMQSILLAILDRDSFMRCCRFPVRANRTGVMRGFRLWAI